VDGSMLGRWGVGACMACMAIGGDKASARGAVEMEWAGGAGGGLRSWGLLRATAGPKRSCRRLGHSAALPPFATRC
jgi:hypothetical protein